LKKKKKIRGAKKPMKKPHPLNHIKTKSPKLEGPVEEKGSKKIKERKTLKKSPEIKQHKDEIQGKL